MSKHLQIEIDRLKKQILFLGAMVEEALHRTAKAVAERDARLAVEIKQADRKIDEMEVEIEEDCLKILALHQPVATDLRFIVAILKINSDLERIGDLAGNIASRAKNIAALPRVELPPGLMGMFTNCATMLKHSLDALVNLDLDLAHQVQTDDDQVDAANREVYRLIIQTIPQRLNDLEAYVNVISISRYLERIADHATNIAQDVIYLMEGEIVRHQHRD